MNLTTFTPRGSNVLVRRIEMTAGMTGGIIVPGNEYGNYAFATVLALGTGNACVSRHIPGNEYMAELQDLSIGDTVIMLTGKGGNPNDVRQTLGTSLPFTVDGERVELIREGMIIAIINKFEAPLDV